MAPSCITFSSDGRQFLAGFVNGDLGLYDMGSCECIKKWKAHKNAVNTVYIASKNSYSIDNDGVVRIFYLSNFRDFLILTFNFCY